MVTSGNPKPRRTGRDHQVAREDDLEAPAEGRPFDGGDQRLSAPTTDDPVLPAALRAVVAPGGEIAARTEDVGTSGQDAGPQVAVVVEFVEGMVERVGHHPVDGVALCHPLHGDDQHVALAASPDAVVDVVGLLHAPPRSAELGKEVRLLPSC